MEHKDDSVATVDVMGDWCPASGSEDEFYIVSGMDTVQCRRCRRWFYPSPQGRLPRHKESPKR